ncbi:uncharacterized protein LOC112590160 isoform X2 [Harpegnathos saltator]|uniref:uncharacterized protein LOC112590160 isoform X2 n=1 Tax=Harpegnathos saltator TaxID=610380 RepID=UPI000DBEEF5A|nr:uncharacterized protein LOC112590160 isoform X2 [Harpegnathos saltator]
MQFQQFSIIYLLMMLIQEMLQMKSALKIVSDNNDDNGTNPNPSMARQNSCEDNFEVYVIEAEKQSAIGEISKPHAIHYENDYDTLK